MVAEGMLQRHPVHLSYGPDDGLHELRSRRSVWGNLPITARDIDVVVSMDSDFSHDPTMLPSLIAPIADGADLVLGSRYVPGGDTVDWPVHRRLLSRWGNRYTAALLGLSVHDCTTGSRAYRASTLRAVHPAETAAEGYAFLTELVRKFSVAGASVQEVPILFRDRTKGSSKMSWRIVVESMLLVSA